MDAGAGLLEIAVGNVGIKGERIETENYFRGRSLYNIRSHSVNHI